MSLPEIKCRAGTLPIYIDHARLPEGYRAGKRPTVRKTLSVAIHFGAAVPITRRSQTQHKKECKMQRQHCHGLANDNATNKRSRHARPTHRSRSEFCWMEHKE
jgi:hypothetical protein